MAASVMEMAPPIVLRVAGQKLRVRGGYNRGGAHVRTMMLPNRGRVHTA